MELIIDMPEERYKHIQEEQWLPNRLLIEKAIANGIPLDAVLDKIRNEIDKELLTYSQEVENMGDSAQKIRISLGIVRKIIDKYRTGSNETQTNEIVYDVGGHMYGAMGGDVIMDILAGKGKE